MRPGDKPPVVHTYRNAYGTHFDVSSSWMLLLGMYVVFVVGMLALMLVIPVRLETNDKMEKPFVAKVKSVEVKQEEKKQVEAESVWSRLLSWLVRTTSSFFVTSPSRADMTQQLATAKTYESIAILTEGKPPSSPQKSPLSRRQTRPLSPSSLLMRATSSPTSMARMRQGSTRFASDVSSISFGGRSRAGSGASVVTTKEEFVHAVLRRHSIADRIERRATLAKEDVKFENEEKQVYEYLEFVRELLGGLTLKKICQKSGRVVSRKLYITADMQVVFWNSFGAIKRQTQKSSLRTERIESVQRGLHGSAKVVARATSDREAKCVSVRCSDGKWLVLEAKTTDMRERLFLGFTRVAHEKQDAATAAMSLEPTIPEDREGEEELVEEKELRNQVRSPNERRAQVVSTLGRGDKSATEAQELDYEEKSPPPSEEELLHRELQSVRARFEEHVDDGDDRQGNNEQEATLGSSKPRGLASCIIPSYAGNRGRPSKRGGSKTKCETDPN